MQIAELFASGVQRTWSLRFWASQFILLVFLWFVFSGQVSTSETWVGLAAAVLCIIAALLAHGKSLIDFRPSPRWFIKMWRLPGSILYDHWILTTALYGTVFDHKRKHGSLNLVGFRAGGDDSTSASRRALAILVEGVSPNSVVIGIDNLEDFMLIHKIEARGEPEYMKDLGVER